jgi:hypothetical protein
MTSFSLFRQPILFLLLLLAPQAIYAQAGTDVRALLADAVKKGLPQVVIPPGTYRLAPGIDIHGAKDLRIVADGVTLVFTKLSRGFDFSHCANVTLRGLTVDYDPLPFTQGKVTAVAPDLSSIDVTIDAGYPRQPYSRIDVCDPATRFRKRTMPFLWGTHAEMVGDNVVRVHLGQIGKTAKLGDPVSLSTGSAPNCPPHAISLGNCSGMVFDHVTVFTAPGMGIIEGDGPGGMRYSHCRVVPGPTPAGATEPRLLSTTWDAIQTKTTLKGPDVENCEIVSAGDDSWSVQSSDYVVVGTDGDKTVVAFRDIYCDGPQPGDHLTRSLNAKPVTITTREEVDLTKLGLQDVAQAKHVGPKAIAITTKEPFSPAVGDSFYCPDQQCNGFVFRNNKLHSPGRILVKASNGVIEDNTIDQCHSGVTVCAEVPGESAVGIENVTIRNNHIAGTGYFCPLWNSSQVGSVSVTATGPDGKMHAPGAFRNIVIERNHFDDICGPSIVVTSAEKLRIIGNTFTRVMTAQPGATGGQVGIDPKALIWLEECEDVKVSGNTVKSPGSFLKELISGRGLAPDVLKVALAGVAVTSPR